METPGAILLALSRVTLCNPLGDYDPFAGAPLEQVSYRISVRFCHAGFVTGTRSVGDLMHRHGRNEPVSDERVCARVTETNEVLP